MMDKQTHEAQKVNEEMLDEILKSKPSGGAPDQAPVNEEVDSKLKIRRIAVVAVLLLIYAGLIAGLFITHNLGFLIGIVAFCILIGPLLKFLKKKLKLEDPKHKY